MMTPWDRDFLFRWPTLDVMNRLQEPLQLSPNVDVKESDNAYSITLDIPGVRKEHVKVTLDNHTLSVSAERTEEYEENEPAAESSSSHDTNAGDASAEANVLAQGPGTEATSEENKTVTAAQSEQKDVAKTSQKVTRKFRSYGHFYRSFELPEDVDIKNISAKHEHGQLKLVIPKMAHQESSATTIEIH